jgi:hypothetical protein
MALKGILPAMSDFQGSDEITLFQTGKFCCVEETHLCLQENHLF